jgi:hypothetical protein
MDALKKYADRYDVTICANVPEALRYLSREEWNVVSLDFDLNGHDFQDPGEITCGLEIVRYIGRCGGWPNARRQPDQIIIHSSNVFGATLMLRRLEELKLDSSLRWELFQYE